MTGSDDYSCNFGFQQRFENYNDLPGVDTAFAQVGGDLIEAGSTGEEFDGYYYVVAGSNDVPPLTVSTSNTTSPGQDRLQTAANNAELVTTGDRDPFTHFPVADLSSDVRDRDPFEVWDQQYN